MLRLFEKIVTSKWFKLVFSVILIYFAFRKINLVNVYNELKQVNLGMVGFILAYSFVSLLIGGYRWALIVLPKVGWKDVVLFTKSTWLGSFYSLLFPSAVGGDLLKWIPLMKKYPELSKTRLATSVLVDRIVGFTAFAIVALIALIIGKWQRYEFPDYFLWLFLVINLGVLVFYLIVYFTDMDKILDRYPKLHRLDEVISILKKENKSKVFKSLVISIFAEPYWIFGSWFSAKMFNVPISPMQIFIFMPIIALILVLPISIAGFGARENLYLYFFTQLGIGTEKILLMSTFNGIISIIIGLLGGLILLI